MTDKLKGFIKSKKYYEWYNFFLEDVSFIKDNVEFMATITHENYVILQMTEIQRNNLNINGYNFWSDWGVNPIQGE